MAFWRQSFIAFSVDREVRDLLASDVPAWIFAPDGSRILWSNPAGGHTLGSERFSDLATRRWAAGHPLRRDVEGLARSAARGPAVARLRLLRNAGAFPTICRTRLVTTASGERGLMLVATDRTAGSPGAPTLKAFLAEDEDAVIEPAVASSSAATGEGFSTFVPGSDGPDLAATLRRHLATTFSALREAGAASTETTKPGTGARIEAGIWAARATPRPQVAPQGVPAAPREPAPAGPPAENAAPTSTPDSPQRPAPSDADWLSIEPKLRVMAGRVGTELDRNPVRFLFQTDAADRFLFVSPGLAQVVGRNSEVIGETWADASQRLRLDPPGRIERAFAQRDTWSGQTAWWPVEGSDVRVPVELTALPVFGGDHSFQGYRGFGILRPAEALMPSAFETRFRGADLSRPVQVPPYEEAASQAPDNVVPIRADVDTLAEIGRLSAQEKSAFEEIAAALQDRIDAGSAGDMRAVPADAIEAEPIKAEAPKPVTPPDDDEGGAATRRGGYVPGVLKRQARSERPGEAQPAAPGPEAVVPQSKPAGPETKPAPDAEASPAAPEKAAPQRTAEEDLRRRLREMTAILDTATDGVIILDAEGLIENVNASAQALFGMDAAAFGGKHFRDLLSEESRQLADRLSLGSAGQRRGEPPQRRAGTPGLVGLRHGALCS